MGAASTVHFPVHGWLRSAFLWIVLLLVLLLRRVNRRRQAWLLWIPLLVSHFILLEIESVLHAHLLLYLNQHAVSSACELLRLFSVSFAILLAVSDLLVKIPKRFLLSFVMFLILFAVGCVGIRLNAWPICDSRMWLFLFSACLLIFTVLHWLFRGILGWLFRKSNSKWWYPTFCLIFSICPSVVVGIIMILQSAASQVYNPSPMMLISIALCGAISLPYLILGLYALGSLFNPFYRQGFLHCFVCDTTTTP